MDLTEDEEKKFTSSTSLCGIDYNNEDINVEIMTIWQAPTEVQPIKHAILSIHLKIIKFLLFFTISKVMIVI